jgi:hypothetical protein
LFTTVRCGKRQSARRASLGEFEGKLLIGCLHVRYSHSSCFGGDVLGGVLAADRNRRRRGEYELTGEDTGQNTEIAMTLVKR